MASNEKTMNPSRPTPKKSKGTDGKKITKEGAANGKKDIVNGLERTNF